MSDLAGSARGAAAVRPSFAHPKLEALAERARHAVELAVERALAHHVDPKRYPLPKDRGCLEAILARRLDRLTVAKREAVVNRARSRLRALAGDRTKRLGDMAQIDLAAGSSVVEQLKAMPIPAQLRVTPSERRAIADAVVKKVFPGFGRVQPTAAAGVATRLDCFVNAASCIRETTLEYQEDEISIGGVTFDNLGTVGTFGPISLGKFETGTFRALGDSKLLTTFDLTQGQFPKPFVVSPILVEVDHGDFADTLFRIGVDTMAISALMLGFGMGTGAFPVAIAGMFGMIIGGVIADLGVLWEDDVFTNNEAFPIIIESDSLAVPNGNRKDISFEGFGGAYRLSFDFATRA